MLEEPRVRRVVGLVADEQLREARREIALEDRGDLVLQEPARVGEHDRQAVHDGIPPAAGARELLAGAVERADVDAHLAIDHRV